MFVSGTCLAVEALGHRWQSTDFCRYCQLLPEQHMRVSVGHLSERAVVFIWPSWWGSRRIACGFLCISPTTEEAEHYCLRSLATGVSSFVKCCACLLPVCTGLSVFALLICRSLRCKSFDGCMCSKSLLPTYSLSFHVLNLPFKE